MGRLVYGGFDQPFDIDDRILAHLRVVFMNKLRRSESFFYHHPDPAGVRSLWIHPSLPIVFHFYGGRHPAINRGWVEQLMTEASGPNGLTVGPEPKPSEA